MRLASHSQMEAWTAVEITYVQAKQNLQLRLRTASRNDDNYDCINENNDERPGNGDNENASYELTKIAK